MSYSRIGVFAALLLLAGEPAKAQPQAYMIHLGPVARTNATQMTAVGRGIGDVTVDGNTLIVKGMFDGLASAATDAHVCVGMGIGTPGVCDSDLDVTKAVQGTVSGNITLNARQKAALPAGRLYVQINSVKAPAPAGNLWGWIVYAHEKVEQDVPQQGHGFLPQYDMPMSVEHGSTHPLAPDKNS